MPQDRTLLYAGRGFEVAHVRLHAPQGPVWSDLYTVASPRVVFPIGRTRLDVRSGDDTWLTDALTAIRFGDATAYRLRPETAAVRHSLVVSGHASVGPTHGASTTGVSVCLMTPQALYRMHAARRQLPDTDGTQAATLVASLVAYLAGAPHQAPWHGAVARARQLLLSEGSGPGTRVLSLDELAEAVSRSPFHLARRFRQQTGLSLHQYRQHLRLASAMERLADGERDLAGLAHDLGYCSQSHLGAVFRQAVGVTLGDARRVLGPAGTGASASARI
ncbi:helix-turn-helix domain-containing protein [Acidovorax cavernicola]|uniref:AraC family transcriptional regulator n=1 Tax=Acidovorax cavernicola TaxID=1675792 RepID=A0A9X8D806_9BURK|nr:AraC family transcriptional regulator [Acidovorax cavernicola]RIX84104.1 AraC family transcriptional regulator [Acidovorax cavernicola]